MDPGEMGHIHKTKCKEDFNKPKKIIKIFCNQYSFSFFYFFIFIYLFILFFN